jgi:hypothetical protein
MPQNPLEENITMSENVQDPKSNKPAVPDSMVQAPVSSDNPLMFQIFFLAQNQSQDVEILETEEIDFGEITQRLKLGESVFIKYKNPEMLEPQSSIRKKGERNSWYFTRC